MCPQKPRENQFECTLLFTVNDNLHLWRIKTFVNLAPIYTVCNKEGKSLFGSKKKEGLYRLFARQRRSLLNKARKLIMKKDDDLIPSPDFLKSLKKGSFILLIYTGSAASRDPSIGIVQKVSKSGFTLNIFSEKGTVWETFVNSKGISHNKGDWWTKIIAPLSDLDQHIKRINSCRRACNKEGILNHKEILSSNRVKREFFDALANHEALKQSAIAAHQSQQNQEIN